LYNTNYNEQKTK